MNRRQILGVLGTTALGGTLLGSLEAQAADDKHSGKDQHYEECATECASCANECSSCFDHCARLVAHGHKGHVATMRLCDDCADLCSTAATLSARKGPLAIPACKACAEACDQCAAACEKFPRDEQMINCAKACRRCAKACRDMIRHLSR